MPFYLPELKAQNWTFIRARKRKCLSVLVCVDAIICSLGNSFQPVYELQSCTRHSESLHEQTDICLRRSSKNHVITLINTPISIECTNTDTGGNAVHQEKG